MEVYQYSNQGGWDQFALETYDDKLIPLIHLAPLNKFLGYIIICNPGGKNCISLALVDELKKKGFDSVILPGFLKWGVMYHWRRLLTVKILQSSTRK